MTKKKDSPVVDQKALIELYRKALVSDFPLEKLKKKVDKLVNRTAITTTIEQKDVDQREKKLKKQLPRVFRWGAAIIPAAFLLVGLFLVGSAVLPIVGYYLKTLPDLQASDLHSPIPQEQVLDVTPLIVAQASTDEIEADEKNDISAPLVIETDLDYTNLSNWFEDNKLPELNNESYYDQEITEYDLEIPELEVFNAKVKVGGTDLNKSLIHYQGTALPGEYGSPVIFGHSVLRQFYNPSEKNPRRFNSIFSKIMTLEKGDKIYVKYGGVKYTYMVNSLSEVKPTDTYILAQRYDTRQLKLVTCVPEGTYLRRGVVTAQLVKE